MYAAAILFFFQETVPSSQYFTATSQFKRGSNGVVITYEPAEFFVEYLFQKKIRRMECVDASCDAMMPKARPRRKCHVDESEAHHGSYVHM